MSTVVLTKNADCAHNHCDTITIDCPTRFTFSGAPTHLITPPGGTQQTVENGVFDAFVAGDYVVCLQGVCKHGQVCTDPIMAAAPKAPAEPPPIDPAVIECLEDIKALIEAQQDFEIVNSGWICGEGGTWVQTTTVYIDGVAGEPTVIDSGISCEEQAPLDRIDIEKLQICDPTTNTLHIKVCQFTTSYDEGEPTTVETELSYTDTGVKCNVNIPISIKELCFLGDPIQRKVGYSVSDFDEGAFEIGQQACIEIEISTDDCEVSNISAPSAPVPVTVTGEGPYQMCFTFDGSTPDWPITADITCGGITEELSGTDLYWGSGGGETVLMEFQSEITVKEFCFYDAPNEYQDAEGNTVDITELTPCPVEEEPPVLLPGAPIAICIEQGCKKITSAGGGQASDWDDPLGSFEFYMNEEFGGQEVEVPTTFSMATMTTDELTRLFKEGIKLSTGCDVTPTDVEYSYVPDGDGFSYEFSMTLCPFGPDECLKQEGWRGFIDMQTNGELTTTSVPATLQHFYDGCSTTPACTVVVDDQGTVLTDYVIVPCVEPEAPCEGTPETWKKKELYFGLENSKTRFNRAYKFEFTLNNGEVRTVDVPASTNWGTQMVAWGTAMEAIFPEACEVIRHWWEWREANLPNTGAGAIPPSDMNFPEAFGQFIQFTFCPTDVAFMPVGVNIIEQDGVELKSPIPMIVAIDESEVEYVTHCIACDPECQEEPPKCAIPASDDFPVLPEPTCTVETLSVCEIQGEDASDPEVVIPAEVITTDVFLQFTTCGAEVSTFAFVLDAEGNPTAHELTKGNYYGDCETLEAISEPVPTCPEGADFKPVEIGGHYYIVDNSNWIGSPTAHIANGHNFEFTFTFDDGSTKVVQQTADPLYNNFIAEASVILGCAVIPVCANHTSPNGCNANHVANLANYPAYDAPTAPADVQNNLTNPDRDELWASGWLLDCGDCNPKPTRIEITNSSTAGYIGAYKEPIVYDKEKTLIYQAVTCSGVYYKDCDGNDIPAPSCCPEPYSAPADNSWWEQFKTKCDSNNIPDANYEGGIEWSIGRPNTGAEWILWDNTSQPAVEYVSGSDFGEFIENMEALGYTEWSSGESHYFCPCPPNLVNAGDYFVTVDGNTVTKPACTPLGELPSAPDKEEIEEFCALRTKGCLDQAILDKLCAIEELLKDDCIDLDVGRPTLLDGETGESTGTIVQFPHVTPAGQLADFITPISLPADDCLTALDPATKIRVRLCWNGHDLETGANGTTGAQVIMGPLDSSGDAEIVGWSGTNTTTQNTTGNPNGFMGTIATGLDVADRWIDWDVPLQDLLDGTTITTSAFGGTNTGVTETLASQEVKILTDLTQFECKQCEECC